jgi:hypothetical protein
MAKRDKYKLILLPLFYCLCVSALDENTLPEGSRFCVVYPKLEGPAKPFADVKARAPAAEPRNSWVDKFFAEFSPDIRPHMITALEAILLHGGNEDMQGRREGRIGERVNEAIRMLRAMGISKDRINALGTMRLNSFLEHGKNPNAELPGNSW